MSSVLSYNSFDLKSVLTKKFDRREKGTVNLNIEQNIKEGEKIQDNDDDRETRIHEPTFVKQFFYFFFMAMMYLG